MPQPIDQITDEVWDHFVELNLWSCMALTRAPSLSDERPEVGPRHSQFANRSQRRDSPDGTQTVNIIASPTNNEH